MMHGVESPTVPRTFVHMFLPTFGYNTAVAGSAWTDRASIAVDSTTCMTLAKTLNVVNFDVILVHVFKSVLYVLIIKSETDLSYFASVLVMSKYTLASCIT